MEEHEVHDAEQEKKDTEKEAEAAAEKPTPEEPVGEEKSEPASRLERTVRERDEFLDLLRRTRAEFSNYRKRVEREREEVAHRSVGDFAKELLPVLDDLDRAFEMVEREHDAQAFLEGIRLVSEKLRKTLQDIGVTPVHPEREPFDPFYHEAVMVEEHDELEPGTVSEVLRKGYMMKGKPLRPAQVKVVKTPAKNSKGAEPEEARDETQREQEE